MTATSDAKHEGESGTDRWEDDGGPRAPPGSTTPTRELIAYHEAGHATIGHAHGLTFEVIYIGDSSGQILFDEQWEPENVIRDADALDRYALMLLAGARAEQRYAGDVHGDQGDAETLECMVREARARGTVLRPGLWQRAEEIVAADWAAIQALAEELVHRSSLVECPRQVLRQYPHLGGRIVEIRGTRAREILNRFGSLA